MINSKTLPEINIPHQCPLASLKSFNLSVLATLILSSTLPSLSQAADTITALGDLTGGGVL